MQLNFTHKFYNKRTPIIFFDSIAKKTRRHPTKVPGNRNLKSEIML